jgi:hypothetical protein
VRTDISQAPIETRPTTAVDVLATKPALKPILLRWRTLKGLTSTITFTVLAILAELLVVLYAMSIGVTDPAVLKVDWPITIVVSPLFDLVPIAVIVTLVAAWVYLTRKMATRAQEPRKPMPVARATEVKKLKQGAGRRMGSLFNRIRMSKVSVRSAVIVLLVFLTLVLVVSLIAYPQLIYRTVQSAYQNNSSLLGFVVSVDDAVNGFAAAVAPIGWIGSAVNGGLIAVAPAVQAVGVGLGDSVAGLAGLDNAGKYLLFQNAATWVSVFLVLFYGEFMRKGYRYKRK